jgi:hypothetical protein
VEDLRRDGFHVFGQCLPEQIVDEMVEHLSTCIFVAKDSRETFAGFKSLTNKAGPSTRWIRNLQDVIECPSVATLATEKLVLDIVRGYLGVEPILMQANCWWSVRGSVLERNPDSDAQMFHQDNEFLSFLKLFVYLNDVTERNGPHRVVQGSHIDFEDLLGPSHEPSSRLPDNQVRALFGPHRLRSLLGKKGTVIAVDTTCLHAGTPVIDGYRSMLQLEYASSPWMSTIQPFCWSRRVAENVDDSLNLEQRFFLNFRNSDYQTWEANITGPFRNQDRAENGQKLGEKLALIHKMLRRRVASLVNGLLKNN